MLMDDPNKNWCCGLNIKICKIGNLSTLSTFLYQCFVWWESLNFSKFYQTGKICLWKVWLFQCINILHLKKITLIILDWETM